MKRRIAGLVLLAGFPVFPQTQIPKTYSYTLDTLFSFGGPAVIKVTRDGSKELIEQTMVPMEGRPTEFRTRLLYDFDSHTLYTTIPSSPEVPRSVAAYDSPGVLRPLRHHRWRR